MPENQNIEYKSSWRDEYLKWICGFANAQGGKLYIGVDDNGVVRGVQNAKKLMEDIPNKIREALGLLVDVNLLSVDSKEYIEISVPVSSDPINYKGEYHYRSGSTKQLLQGPVLTQFFDKRPEKVTERVTERVTENQAIIIREMEKNPFVTAIGLAKILGISLRKTKENIKKLQQKGFIRRIGPDKGGHWKENR